MHVSILVATRDRPTELQRLFESFRSTRFRELEIHEQPTVDVVVVDNSSVPLGLDGEQLAEACGWPVSVVVEPRTGIPFARNTALRHRSSRADYAVFVDDDITVTPSWLEQLVLTAESTGADFVSGRYLARVPESTPAGLREALLGVRTPSHPHGTIVSSAPTGNLLITSAWLDSQAMWLDETFALAGGSDVEWTARSVDEGATIVHTDRAVTWHWLSAARASHRWLAERAFRVGYGHAELLMVRGLPRRRVLVRAVLLLGGAAVAVVRAVCRRDGTWRATVVTGPPAAIGWLGCGLGASRPQVYRRVTSEAR